MGKETVFSCTLQFERKLRDYLQFCNDGERLPNVAGFCRFAKIRRADFAALKARFPLAYDVAESTFIDEALNHRAPNTAATMTFLIDQVTLQEDAPRSAVQIICAQDVEADGA